MRTLSAACLVHFLVAFAPADAPKSDAPAPSIRLPQSKAPKSEPVAPAPAPGEPLALKAGARYVVAARTRCDVFLFPAGLAEVEEKSGPRDWTGVFADGAGEVEDRHYPEQFLYAIKARPGARGELTVLVVPRGYKDRSEVVQTTVRVEAGEGALPPPKPVEPKVEPVPTGPLRVLFVYETSKPLTREQQGAIFSPAVEKYLDEKCAKDGKGAPEWKRFDKDQQFAASFNPTLKRLFADSRDDAVKVMPAVVVAVGTRATVYPVTGEAELLAVLRKHGDAK